MEVFLIIICVVIVFIAIISISNNSSRKEALNSEVQKISENGFVADKKFVSKDSKASLMIDSKNKKVAVSAANINGAKIQVYDDFVCDNNGGRRCQTLLKIILIFLLLLDIIQRK